MNLTDSQQVFAVFYAIFFGIMMQTIGSRRTNPDTSGKEKRHDITLNLFDTPNAWAIGFRYDNKPFWRAMLSIFVLDIVPGIIFALVFLGLGALRTSLNFIQILAIVWIALSPQYIYRVYHAILVMFDSGLYLNKGEYDKYNDYDINAVNLIKIDRKQYPGHKSSINHLAFPVFFFFPSLIILYDYFLVSGQINGFFVYLSIALLIIGIVLFISPRNYK